MALGCAACNGYFGLAGYGLGQSCTFDDQGNMSCDTSVDGTSTIGGTSVLDLGLPPTAPTIGGSETSPIVTSTSNPFSTSNINWNSILGAWTNAGTAIAKAEAGANPTFQETLPSGASITEYGNVGSQIGSALATNIGGGFNLGGLLIFGVVGIIVFSMIGEVGKHH